jgi:CubicO group peptidase (beta-lactamase class C family)
MRASDSGAAERTVEAKSDRILHGQSLLSASLQDMVGKGITPGIGAGVCISGQNVLAFAGSASLETQVPFCEESRFEISCLMKFFTSLVALDLAEREQLDINAPVGHYLEDLRGASRDKCDTIRVSHLLSHTAGYRGPSLHEANVKWNFSWDQLLHFMAETEQLFRPGTAFSYEHSGHVILGELLRRITGEDPVELVDRLIFSPLRISFDFASDRRKSPERDVDAYTYSRQKQAFEPVRIPPPGKFWRSSLSDVRLTLGDVLKIGDAILGCGGSDHAPPLLSPGVLKALREPTITLPKQVYVEQYERLPRSFGNGCGQYLNGVIGHNGSVLGQTCALRLVPEKHLCAALVINTWLPHRRDALIERMVRNWTSLERDAQPNSSEEGTPACEIFGPFDWRELPGTYWGGFWREIELQVAGTQMRAQARTQRNTITLFNLLDIERERVLLDSKFPVSAIFFPHPDRRTPCLMVGPHAYVKR